MCASATKILQRSSWSVCKWKRRSYNVAAQVFASAREGFKCARRCQKILQRRITNVCKCWIRSCNVASHACAGAREILIASHVCVKVNMNVYNPPHPTPAKTPLQAWRHTSSASHHVCAQMLMNVPWLSMTCARKCKWTLLSHPIPVLLAGKRSALTCLQQTYSIVKILYIN